MKPPARRANQGTPSQTPAGIPGDKERGNCVVADDVFSKVLRLVRVVQAGLKNLEGSVGVSGSQLWVLWQLSAQPGQRVKELAESLHMHPSTASNLLDKLEARGLVRRERRDLDNRVVRIYLAEAGARIVRTIPGPTKGELRHALRQVPEPVLAGLLKGVTAVLQIMDHSPTKSPH
ncbi:MAG: MarR family transcriptional regulator [Betaproteobacteria bacterium]|nr:MarR family transcriptional regulator [Betaproteobacteria bacterium]